MKLHDAALLMGGQGLRVRPVEGGEVHVRIGRVRPRPRGHIDHRPVFIEAQIERDLAGPFGERDRHHAVEAEGRRAQRGRLIGAVGPQGLVDLVMEDQRQAREAQHQHERRRDEAGPFMDHGPGADGVSGHAGAGIWAAFANCFQLGGSGPGRNGHARVPAVSLRSEIHRGRNDEGPRSAQHQIVSARIAAGGEPVGLVGQIFDASPQG